MSAKFCRLDVILENRPVYDALGRVVPEMTPRVGAHLFHWADPVRARGWFQVARKLLADKSRLALLDAPINKTDQKANRAQAASQTLYVAEILTAIARGYNLLNVVWWNDPEARRLYRTYIAGSPQTYSGNSGRSIFEETTDYNEGWYTKDNAFPLSSMNGGSLQAVALNTLGSRVIPGKPFAISAQLLLSPIEPLRSGQLISSASALYNVPMVRSKFAGVCSPVLVNEASIAGSGYTRLSFPVGRPIGAAGAPDGFGGAFGQAADLAISGAHFSDLGFPWADQCKHDAGYGLAYSPEIPVVILPGGEELPAGFDDWRGAYLVRVGGFITAPLRAYLAYFAAWTQSLIDRMPGQIIQDSRAFVAYQNKGTIDNNGGVSVAIDKLLNTDSQIYDQQHQPSPTAAYAAASIAALGAALGTVTSGISAVVGGAIAAIISVADMLILKGTSGHGRDDLGRYKLQFERSWLSGNPAQLAADQGAPSLPPSEISDPPGAGVLWTDAPCPPAITATDPAGTNPVNSKPKSSGNGWMWGLALAGLIALGYSAKDRK